MYDEVFAPRRFVEKGWLEIEKRWASLSMIGDLMLEVIEPSAEPGDQLMPLSRFRGRFGQHFHSLSWYVDGGGVKPLFDRLRAMGVRVAKPGGGIWPDGDIDPGPTIFTHPKDTFRPIRSSSTSPCTGSESIPGFKRGGRRSGGRTSTRSGFKGCRTSPPSFGILIGPRSSSKRGSTARFLGQSETDVQRSSFVMVGTDSVVELASPVAPDSPIARDLAANGELPHACTFTVRDLDAVERHMDKVGVGVASRTGDCSILQPTDCFGAVYRFTTATVPGDPRHPEPPGALLVGSVCLFACGAGEPSSEPAEDPSELVDGDAVGLHIRVVISV